MGITDNLAPLFDQGLPAVRFRQGTILTWDPANGANTIDLAGGTLTNVGMMNIGEAISLKPGHVVGMLGQGSTWFIIGRITLPGDSNFAAASVAFGHGGAQLFNFSVSTSLVLKATSTEIVVPDWADEAIVHVTGNACAVNNSGTPQAMAMEVGVNGGGGGGAWGSAPSLYMMGCGASSRNHFTGLSGGETLTLQASLQATAAIAINATNALFLHAIAVFKSNV